MDILRAEVYSIAFSSVTKVVHPRTQLFCFSNYASIDRLCVDTTLCAPRTQRMARAREEIRLLEDPDGDDGSFSPRLHTSGVDGLAPPAVSRLRLADELDTYLDRVQVRVDFNYCVCTLCIYIMVLAKKGYARKATIFFDKTTHKALHVRARFQNLFFFFF